MSISKKVDGQVVTITIAGDFGFKSHSEFHDVIADIPSGARFILDFGRTKYVDSSGLGLLLLLREKAGGNSADISLVNCPKNIRSLFQMAQFGELFHLT